ncbi:Ca(2+)-dependent cysteine protease [Tulasnella sp. 427]|nr:Ca(2+)-dependent cysteine protease [Tulasnella sp. 427]
MLFKRKALLIAVGYCDGQVWPDSTVPMNLSGPHNDVERWKDYLIQQGWAEKHIRILTDKPGTPPEDWPTRLNIISAMQDLMHGKLRSKSPFAVAGHRSQVPSRFGYSDVNGMGKAFFPMDVEHPIHDYVMDVCLVKTLIPGARLTMVIDACNVGVPFGVPWEFTETYNGLTNVNVDPEARLGSGNLAKNQKAREVKLRDGRHYGAMTFYVTELLKRARNGIIPMQLLLATVNCWLREGGQEVTVRLNQPGLSAHWPVRAKIWPSD